MDCGTTRYSIHSECPYSDVHFWQRICAKLRGQRGVKTEPDSSKSLGKWTYGEPKGEDSQGVVTCNMRKQVELRMSQNGIEAWL